MDFITIPFGYLLDYLYRFTGNYGISLILFAVLVQLVLLPITIKSKKSMMKMTRLQPRIQAIKEKYANDQQKQQEAIQQLQQEEGASMGCGGCLWSLVPLLILIPLYSVVREPIVYMFHESAETASKIIEVIKGANPDLFTTGAYYEQIIAISNIGQYADLVKEALPEISEHTLTGLNAGFIGIDLGGIPQFNIFDSKLWAWDWAHIGALLIPLISAGSQILQTLLNQRSNNSLITDKNGLQDKEAAKKADSAQTGKMMMWMMPIMSLWIGFTVPAALSLYWFVGGIVRTVEDLILTKKLRKAYDAEDAERLKKALEKDALEEEKERQRAERRAANPDGITENTSKKKLQKQQQQADEAARAAAKREYDAKRGIEVEEAVETKKPLSGIADRPYCKGRAYDPDRYKNTEE
ncbi:MAG: membrane protein insertase YidC [Ruminococcaceae bacterium]|nr:membrane protein insertase YidC [Oscillospiraceae bacterium]